MKLNTICKMLVETKYVVRMEFLDGHFETITMDYIDDDSENFSKALFTRNRWNSMKHKVQFITVNTCTGLLTIDVIERK